MDDPVREAAVIAGDWCKVAIGGGVGCECGRSYWDRSSVRRLIEAKRWISLEETEGNGKDRPCGPFIVIYTMRHLELWNSCRRCAR